MRRFDLSSLSLTPPRAATLDNAGQWSPQQTYDWLASKTLGDLVPFLAANAIDAETLIMCDVEELAGADGSLALREDEFTAAVQQLRSGLWRRGGVWEG